MTEWLTLGTAFLLGLFSSAHCVGMCGGIMGALSMAIPADAIRRRWVLLTSYNLGRIASYSLMGLIFGFFTSFVGAAGGVSWLRILAGLLLIAMGLYLANWWRGLTYLERIGRYFWAYLQPLSKSLMPVTSVRKALFLGALWGWLPCGLVYSALAYAMAQTNPLAAASVMLAFGLGTLPAVLASGFILQQLAQVLQARAIRSLFALLIIMFGIWTIVAVTYPNHSHHHNTSDVIDSSIAPAATEDHSHHHH